MSFHFRSLALGRVPVSAAGSTRMLRMLGAHRSLWFVSCRLFEGLSRKGGIFSSNPSFYWVPAAECHTIETPYYPPLENWIQCYVSRSPDKKPGVNEGPSEPFARPACHAEGGKGDELRLWSAISQMRSQKVEDIVESLQQDHGCATIRLSENLVSGLLCRFGDDWKSALGFFQWSGMQTGYKHGTATYNKMIDLLGKMKQMDRMWILVNEMREGDLVTVETVSKMMRRLMGAGRYEEAINVFNDLEEIGLHKDTQNMNSLLGTLCKEKKVETAREVFLYYRADFSPDAHTFNILVHGWCLLGNIDEAELTILEMKRNGILPSVITYSTLIHAYCNQLNFCKVFELLDKMVDEGCPPNIVTYTSVINSLASSEEIEGVLEVVERMRSFGCKPDIFFYNSLISILGKGGHLDKAIHAFEVEILQDKISPDLSIYNTMISVLCHHHMGQAALNILKRIEHSPWKPNLETYGPLLKLCIRVGADDILCKLLDDIVNKFHLSLDSGTYALLVHGLCRASKFESAFHFFEDMVCRDIPPRDKKTYELLLAEAERRGLSDAICRIKDMMNQLKFAKGGGI